VTDTELRRKLEGRGVSLGKNGIFLGVSPRGGEGRDRGTGGSGRAEKKNIARKTFRRTGFRISLAAKKEKWSQARGSA